MSLCDLCTEEVQRRHSESLRSGEHPLFFLENKFLGTSLICQRFPRKQIASSGGFRTSTYQSSILILIFSNFDFRKIVHTGPKAGKLSKRLPVCVCVGCHHFHSGRQVCGRTSRVTQEEGPTGFLHLPSAVLALILSREGFSRPFPSSTVKSILCTHELIVLHLLGILLCTFTSSI